MDNYSETFIEKHKDIDFESSEHIFTCPDNYVTTNALTDSNYFTMNNRKNGVSIQINVRMEKIKAINKRINK